MKETRPIDLLIEAGYILTLDKDMRVLRDSAIAIDAGKILSISPITASSDAPMYQARQVIDAADCIVLPGLINAHTHISMSFFRGVADDLPLITWLRDYIWPLEDKFVNPEFVYDATLYGAAEMIKSGISYCNDMYFYGNEIAKALSKAGMRGQIGEAIIQVILQNSGGLDTIGALARELSFEYRNNPLVDFCLAPHSIYTCDRQVLTRVAGIATKYDLPVHMHLSETQQEVLDCLKAHGRKPVHYLKETGLLEARCIFAHGVWVDEDEMDLLAEYGCSVVSCVDSNLKLASGFAPIAGYYKHGVNVCLGTDGVASNNNLDLLAELDTFAKLHKALAKDPTFLPAPEALKTITINAARALGRESELGSLEPGKAGDILILNSKSLSAQPLYNPYSQVVYAMGSEAVQDLIINGKIILKDKQLTLLDEAALIKTAGSYSEKIRQGI